METKVLEASHRNKIICDWDSIVYLPGCLFSADYLVRFFFGGVLVCFKLRLVKSVGADSWLPIAICW